MRPPGAGSSGAGPRPRAVHPVAWWVWGLSIGAAALRLSNPLLVALLVAAVGLVVAARRRPVPWARSFGAFLALAAVVVVVRLLLQALFAPPVPGHVLVTLPAVDLPAWAAGVRVGGPVTAESLAGAFYDALRLVGLLAAVGAANALADPHRLLRVIPTALYEAGVAVTVALSIAPQTVAAAGHVREARRLRGRPTRGLAGIRGIALPVFERSLDRSIALAASMDARGFGRRPERSVAQRRAGTAALAIGALAVAVGVYGLLDAAAPAALGAPMLVLGGVLVAAALARSGAGHARTRYRPDPWSGPEWATVASGLAVLAGVVVAGHIGVDLAGPTSPLRLPGLPLLPAAAVLVAALPAVATPEPPR